MLGYPAWTVVLLQQGQCSEGESLATMKGLGINRNRHLSDSCEPSSGLPEVMYPLAPDPRSPFLLSPTIDHYGTMDSHHFPPTSPTSLPPECMLPLNNQMTNSSTFPRIHYNSEFAPSSMPGIPSATLGTSMPFGMSVGMSVGVGGTPIITSGSATISTGSKINRLPANLLDQFEKQLPVQRDGFSTLQFHRSRTSKQRSESPGRIRYLVHSVQKLFAKSQSLEASIKGNLNGRAAEGKRGRRSKSKDRAKTESAKRRTRSNILGLWSSEDNLDDDAGGCHAPVAMMTLGRSAPESQGALKVFPQGYNTISENTLKASKSNNDLKVQVCPPFPVPADGTGNGGGGEGGENKVVKRSSWSTLTLSQARQVCQMGSATIDKSLLKSKSCHQDLTCRYLQAGEWNNTMGRSRGSSEIPCRRMRSGSYVKAMGDQEDSEDSEGSPKPSPKMAGRRQSYLKATQQSLSEQLPSRNCLPSLQELSTNRSLDNLDCISGPPSATFPNWDEEDFSLVCNTLGKIGCVTKMQDPEVGQTAENIYQDSPFVGSNTQPATEAVDLPSAACFRSRSHSYLRAIQAGCSQDEDTASLDSDSPPPTATTVRTYSSSTTSTCITTCKRTPPPVPPRIAAKPFISVTVQSSTESAHDTYLENQERRTEAPPSASRPVPSYPPDGPERVDAAQPSPCTTQQEPPTPSSPPKESQHDTAQSPADTLTPEEPQAEPGPKRKLSSIGIQVDCLQPVQKEETPPLTRFQSIGVQVEDSWQLNRSSSMASKPEADSDMQDDPKPADKGVADSATQPESEPAPNTQGSSEGGTGCQVSSSAPSSSSSSSSESLDPALDPSSLPPPDPWLESVTSNGGSVPTSETPPVGAPACRRDGHWFLKLLQAETARMEGWCQQMEQETKDHQLSEEVLGRVRSAVGSAQLLMSQKFQQFRGLCDQNLNVDANPRPTAQDLAGFWDLLQLSIEDISMKFDELYHLKSNDWQLSDSPDKKEDKKQPPPVPKKPSKAKLAANREKGNGGGGGGGGGDPADKQRQEARKRLMAAKRAASVRQNSATESADSIEIYVPEAQTRL